MRNPLLLFVAFFAFAGCDQLETNASADKGATDASALRTPVDMATPLPSQVNAKDLRPCPGMDIQRPAGTNCYGVLPSVCGADKATAFVGQMANAGVRASVAAAVVSKDIRWIKPGDAMIENFAPERLNIFLDAKGRMESADCF